MKKLACFAAVVLAAASLVAFGIFLGRRMSAPNEAVASDVFKTSMFNSAFLDLSHAEVVLEQLDSGRTEDARYTLRLHQDGAILALENVIEDPARLTPADMSALHDLNSSLRASSGSQRQAADTAIARVARHRAAHPWTYTGALPHGHNAEVDSQVASILKRASDTPN